MADDVILSLGNKLKAIRLSRGITIKVIASRMGKSSPYISMVENDKSKPNSEYLFKFANALYSDIDDIEIRSYIVAERYIDMCNDFEIEIMLFPRVEEVLKSRGMYFEDEILNKPFLCLNWLFENNTPLVFGLSSMTLKNRVDLAFTDLEPFINSVTPLNPNFIFSVRPKLFITLDQQDKHFILMTINNYIQSKYKLDFEHTPYNMTISKINGGLDLSSVKNEIDNIMQDFRNNSNNHTDK